MRAAVIKYLDFIRTEHPRVKPFRGVGFQGITLAIGTTGGNQTEQCYFQVSAPGNPMRIAITKNQTLSKAWDRAVSRGQASSIRPKDIDSKRQTPPTPEKFKLLRKHMNEEESASLGVGVLHHVYAEQRAELERQKSRTRLEREISEFMDKSGARA